MPEEDLHLSDQTQPQTYWHGRFARVDRTRTGHSFIDRSNAPSG